MAKTREEFESSYNSGDIKTMILSGRLPIECRCVEDMCEGWKMSHIDWLEDDMEIYGNTASEVAVARTHHLELVRQFKLDGDKID